MKIEKTETEVKVELEDERLTYDREEWSEEQNYLGEENLWKLPEWKIDLIKNHGISIDELRSTD